jgi:hypothetical protein
MSGWRMSIVLLLVAAVAGCDAPGDVYPRPPAEVRELLRTVEVPLYMFGNTADTRAVVDASRPDLMVWNISADGAPLMRFTAALTPEGDNSTRVWVDVEGSASGRYGNLDARLRALKEVRQLYLASMTEAVDSTLDGRAYDITATYGALMAATTANSGRLFPPATAKDRPASPGNGR